LVTLLWIWKEKDNFYYIYHQMYVMIPAINEYLNVFRILQFKNKCMFRLQHVKIKPLLWIYSHTFGIYNIYIDIVMYPSLWIILGIHDRKWYCKSKTRRHSSSALIKHKHFTSDELAVRIIFGGYLHCMSSIILIEVFCTCRKHDCFSTIYIWREHMPLYSDLKM
jgi:hypothetical protein